MFKLESKKLQREFNINEGMLYASQIINTESGMKFIPDGSGCEFAVRFADGDEFTSKNLTVKDAVEKDGSLYFRFNEEMNTTVTVNYRIAKDGSTIEKQIAISQSEPKVIDYVLLENIGIVNSQSSFSVNGNGADFYSNLGQPFYIDSLFFGCLFPAAKSEIAHGRGEIKYYVGKSAEGKILCPTTVMGAAEGPGLFELKNAFFEYLEGIALPCEYRLQYSSKYDRGAAIDANSIQKSMYKIEKQLSRHGAPPLEAYTVDEGWSNYKSGKWEVNQKKFPNGLLDASYTAKSLGSGFGLWVSPRGGFEAPGKFAKRIEKSGFGNYNAEADEICTASEAYIKNMQEALVRATKENDVSYWKLDGFMLKPCLNEGHGHIVGGEEQMYEITEHWERWIKLIKALRKARQKQGKDLFINLVNFVNPSPFWLQYVNAVYFQEAEQHGDGQRESETLDEVLTERDSRYYDTLFTKAYQLPLWAIYNGELIYGRNTELDFSDDEFEKLVFWRACCGAALNEMSISRGRLEDEKWAALVRAANWQRANYDILKNAIFIGGNPAEDNIYLFSAWDKDANGIIALRNPSNESTPLTLTLNKLMGCPEGMSGLKRTNIYNRKGSVDGDVYNYNDQINLTLAPYEIKIFQFSSEGEKPRTIKGGNEFTISFESDGNDGVICQNNDIRIAIEKGFISIAVGAVQLKSESIISSAVHRITVVREKNRMVKLYIDNFLDCSAYSSKAKPEIDTELMSRANAFSVSDRATPYNEIVNIVELKEILKQARKKRKEANKR